MSSALKQSIHSHCDKVADILLASKNTKDKKAQIEAAFCYCKEAFVELSVAYINLLSNSSHTPLLESIGEVVRGAVMEVHDLFR